MSVPKSVLRVMAGWRRYAAEAFFSAALMFCIEIFVVVLEHPGYSVRHLVDSAGLRRALLGVMMGGVICLLCASPWGKRSGAHMNPAVTLAFWTLGRIKGIDAIIYAATQVAGALGGIASAAWLTDGAVAHPAIDYAVTRVGAPGVGYAFFAELGMSFLLMSGVLWASAWPRMSAYAPALTGVMIAVFVTVEAPMSGMSINPTRTLTSGLMAGHLERFWLYASAPVAGMLIAAWVFRCVSTGRVTHPPEPVPVEGPEVKVLSLRARSST